LENSIMNSKKKNHYNRWDQITPTDGIHGKELQMHLECSASSLEKIVSQQAVLHKVNLGAFKIVAKDKKLVFMLFQQHVKEFRIFSGNDVSLCMVANKHVHLNIADTDFHSVV